MGLNWYVIAPPTSGVITGTMKKLRSIMTGQQPEFGPLQAELPSAKASFVGQHPFTGPIAATTKKPVASFIGSQDIPGTLGASMKNPKANIVQASFVGEIEAKTSKLVSDIEGMSPMGGDIEVSTKKPIANVAGTQNFPAALAAQLKKAISAIAGSQNQSGTVAMVLKKPVMASEGNIPKQTFTYSSFSVVPDVLYVPLTTNIVASDVSLAINGTALQENNGPGKTYQFAAIFPDQCSTNFITAIATNAGKGGSTNRMAGVGIFNSDGSKGVYVVAPVSGQGNGYIVTVINGVTSNRVSSSGINWGSGNTFQLLPSVGYDGLVTWTLYKNGNVTSYLWKDYNNEIGLPGNRVAPVFHHIYSSGHFKSPGIAAISFYDL